ncbi:hypothetical protein [Candidatus Formimonas warabiya]|nr:hypothetical protein [Candidatus Formimonas warabiya]
MNRLRIAMIGFGNAGKAFARILLGKRQEILETMDYDVQIVAIATATRGNLSHEQGIDLEKILRELQSTGKFDRNGESYSSRTTAEIIEKTAYDVLMEITPLEIFSGQPAIDHIRQAFGRKKHVITANKGPIAWAFRELKNEAEKQGVYFFYETTVMDGTPVFNLMDETLPMCRVSEVTGILNSTTNFILEEISRGKTWDEAIAEGKRKGFVEADPSLDIEGWDAAAKTAALLNVFMEADIKPTEIKRQGIVHITREDIIDAKKRNRVIKLVCHGWRQKGHMIGEVAPREIKKDHIFAGMRGTSSILSLTTDLMGSITIMADNPKIEQTGYGLFSDTLRLIRKLK